MSCCFLVCPRQVMTGLLSSMLVASLTVPSAYADSETTASVASESAPIAVSTDPGQTTGSQSGAEALNEETTSPLLSLAPDAQARAEAALNLIDVAAILRELDSPTTLPLAGSQALAIPEAAPLPVGEIRDLLRREGRGVQRLTPMLAVMTSLQKNRELAVQALRPSISATGIDSALAEFDPSLRASIVAGQSQRSTLGPRPRESSPDFRDQDGRVISRNTDVSVDLGARIPTGTNLSVGVGASRDRNNRTRDFYGTDLSLNATQNLLRGRGIEFNMARVRIARNDLAITRHQLEAYLINLVSDVLLAYADLYLAVETLRIRLESWEVAGQQAEQFDEFLRVGRATPLDSLTARAEQSSRAGDVINAAAQLKIRQLTVARLLGGNQTVQGRQYLAELSLAPQPMPVAAVVPVAPSETVNVTERLRLAMVMRPELPQAALELQNGELEVVRTRNGLLPRLDFAVRVGTSGVGDSLSDAFDRAGDSQYGSWSTGLELEVPLGNRAARAADRRANFSRDLAERALANQRQQVEFEVRRALIEVERARRLVLTTEIARRQREQSLFNERERLNVGSGTRLEVTQAERDLIQAQIEQVSAQVGLARAFIELHRAEGSTLARTGVAPFVAERYLEPVNTPRPSATPRIRDMSPPSRTSGSNEPRTRTSSERSNNP